MKRPGQGRRHAAKSERGQGVPRIESSRAKQEGAGQRKRQQNVEEGVQTPRTGTCGLEQAAGAAAPWTGSSGDKRRPDATDWIIRGGRSSRSRRSPAWSIQGQGTEDAPDWIVRGKT